jgi:hypothetical protein
MTWGRPLPPERPPSPSDLRLQGEVREFLEGFRWKNSFGTAQPIAVADVGARNFALAPVIREMLLPIPADIHGFEIDAFRRLVNFRTRADYGHYYARRTPGATYHPYDFMRWEQDLDLILLLHPFVKPEPLLSWGLPLSTFRPEALFAHCRKLLTARQGKLIFCSPTPEEFALSTQFAERAGFKVVQKNRWTPTRKNLQTLPRLGAWAE